MTKRAETHAKDFAMPSIAAVSPRALMRAVMMSSVLIAAVQIAGCKRDDGVVTGTIYPDDYRVRHAIALVNAPETLDVFVGRNMAGLDARQTNDIRVFAAEFRQSGRGPITMLVPVHTKYPAAYHRGAQSVRSVLTSAGVGQSYVRVASYQGADDTLASAVRLSFSKLQAKVSSKCGDWSQDIGGTAATTEGWQNKPYRNFGCAYQTMIANQVADPLDLQRARSEDRSDVLRRMKVFEDLRKANDPATNWRSQGASVK
jgi:pilus assembly protein CpaD